MRVTKKGAGFIYSYFAKTLAYARLCDKMTQTSYPENFPHFSSLQNCEWPALVEGDTEVLAGGLAACLEAGDMILLLGDLGAGKSSFARALIRSALAQPDLTVPSPTYTLMQVYARASQPSLYHYDLYRLDSTTIEDELLYLDWDDATADGIVLVEWPQRLPKKTIPDMALVIKFESMMSSDGADARHVSFWGDEAYWADKLRPLAELAL